eukprot:1096189-Prymnesium_polylepis.1
MNMHMMMHARVRCIARQVACSGRGTKFGFLVESGCFSRSCTLAPWVPVGCAACRSSRRPRSLDGGASAALSPRRKCAHHRLPTRRIRLSPSATRPDGPRRVPAVARVQIAPEEVVDGHIVVVIGEGMDLLWRHPRVPLRERLACGVAAVPVERVVLWQAT